jgi:hypothetical protein
VIEDGLYSLFQSNESTQSLWGTDNNGNPEFQMFYLGVIDPVETPPYAVLTRRRRQCEQDLDSNNYQLVSEYTLEVFHVDSWALLNLQQSIRSILESLPLTTVGGVFIQRLQVTDDYNMLPPNIQEVRVHLYMGVLEFEVIHNPSLRKKG